MVRQRTVNPWRKQLQVRVLFLEPLSQISLARGKRKNFGASFQVHRFGLREELGRGPGNVGGAWKFSQRFQVLFIDTNGRSAH